MRLIDVFIISALALLPFVLDLETITNYLPFLRLLIGGLAIYYLVKGINLFFDNHHKDTLIQISIHPDPLDFILGLLWGSVIFQYYTIDSLTLFFWVLMGTAIFWIGFMGSTVIHETKGIRPNKRGKWIAWDNIQCLVLNPAFFTFQTKDNEIHTPILAKSLLKTTYNQFNDNIIKLGVSENIPTAAGLPNTKLLTHIEAPTIQEDAILDDVFTKNEYMILLHKTGFILSDIPYFIPWKRLFRTHTTMDKLTIRFEVNFVQSVSKTFYKNDFELEDWQSLVNAMEQKELVIY